MTESPANLALAVDAYNRYPGELATFYLRFTVPKKTGATLQFAMPKSLKVESYQLPEGIPTTLPSVVEVDQDMIVLIPLSKHFNKGQTYNIIARVRINTFYFNQYLMTEARLVAADGTIIASESVQVTVYGKGRYLQDLPEIYENDHFTSRFLMLFESFWKPISQQIDQVENYFDPDLTPPEFIPWLASWIGLPLDDSLPMERMRALIKHAIMLFQCRGTYQALRTYLEIYTDGQVNIVERRAKNFVLGKDTGLGLDIALGTENMPNSVRIALQVPPGELLRSGYSESMYQRKMFEIVRTMVPAHTVFDITCAFEAQTVSSQ
jgi:phage tail-like protein